MQRQKTRTNNPILIGITIGVFLAGIGLGYLVSEYNELIPPMFQSEEIPDEQFRQQMNEKMSERQKFLEDFYQEARIRPGR